MSGSYTIIVQCILILSLTGLILFAAGQRTKIKHLTAQLVKIRIYLEDADSDRLSIRQQYQENLQFQKKLDEAEITTRLQQPRLSAQHNKERIKPPERYQFVRSMANNGLDAEEIATILSISTHEAEQLVNLSKLADGVS